MSFPIPQFTSSREHPRPFVSWNDAPPCHRAGVDSYPSLSGGQPNLDAVLQLGTVNVYSMDHHDTEHSRHLKCEKTEAVASNAIDPTDLDSKQIPTCARELEAKFGDLAAFSTTSAAMDLATFLSDYGNDASTTVYGVGYGSLWVERLMHLNPPEVTGYVFDGPTTISGGCS
ncbi:unnamed protein product [Phytophthora fragariaefolia]|uniref:Unnamed protein product n=1 Tax=Phytophthora fragariaefolia TaxID=1490495 RepID=A0A9W6YIN3_9STRA|nr:unnamed protein product [Phytophthora fragariaefolia]